MSKGASGTLDEPALRHARRTFAELRPDDTVSAALASIRAQELDSAIVYFYVIGAEGRLHGVVPTRRLLTAAPDARVSALMTPASVTLPPGATLRDAAAVLLQHRLLAVPIVGPPGRMLGVVDASALGVEISAELRGQRLDELFHLIGLRVSERGSGGFGGRLLALSWNVVGGLLAAFVAGANDDLLRTVAALALFMPVTLALSESIGMQAVAIALEGRSQTGDTVVPRVLRRLRRNPTVAAGPAVLALADVVSLLVYFRIGALLLR